MQSRRIPPGLWPLTPGVYKEHEVESPTTLPNLVCSTAYFVQVVHDQTGKVLHRGAPDEASESLTITPVVPPTGWPDAMHWVWIAGAALITLGTALILNRLNRRRKHQ